MGGSLQRRSSDVAARCNRRRNEVAMERRRYIAAPLEAEPDNVAGVHVGL